MVLSSLLLEEVDIASKRVPEHVAIIMDGNRRWARKHGLPFMAGHWQGVETLTQVVTAASELGIKTLTVFGFSTENWNRSPIEVNALIHLFKLYLFRQRKKMVEEGVRLHIIGDVSKLSADVQRTLQETLQATEKGTKIDLVIAFNYGGRDEIKRAIQSLVKDCLLNKVALSEISEAMIAKYLDTASWRDPDLLIRTSGENRISNFLLWQSAYTEFVFLDTYWPDFSKESLLQAIGEYHKRELRCGR